MEGVRLNAYRIMWLFVFFDLPTDTKKDRKNYTVFRKKLQQDGFTMMQYSVYVRHCPSPENAVVHEKRVKRNLPPDGEVRVVRLTDKQFGKMKVFHGKRRKIAEQPPSQLEMF